MKFNKIQIDLKKFTKLNFKEISTIKIEKVDFKEKEIKDYECYNGNNGFCNINECDERENKNNIGNIDKKKNFIFEEKNHSTEFFIKPNEILEINRLKSTWREVYKVKFESNEPFVPGDSIGILCPNKDEFPQKIIKLLNLENDQYKIERKGLNPFKFTGKLFDFFKYVFDFTSLPKKAFINKISNGNQYLDFLCSKEGSKDYFKMIKNWNNVIDLIIMFDLKLKLEDLLAACETLKPRYFSLINKIGDNHEILVGITSKIVQVEDKNGDKENVLRYGHVSQFIKNPNGDIKIIMRPSKLIRLNKDPKHLLICTGTGIAPFLSFLKNKQEDQNSWIIYGFRNDNDDLFDNGNAYKNTKIDKVKSSEGEYVTDFILKKLEKIIEFTKEDCSVYVCGRMDMQKNVYKIFLTHLKKLIEDKKIFFDNWQ